MILCEDLFDNNSEWTEVDSKSVKDRDGFVTDYTWYTNGDEHICIFGDKDMYTPYNTTPDVDGYYGEEGAKAMAELFANYNGFDDLEEAVDPVVYENLCEDFSESMPKWLTGYIQSHKRVKEKLIQNQWDLSRLTFVKVPRAEIPTSGFHPLLKDDTKQLVYLLRDRSNNHVYMPGINEDDVQMAIDPNDPTKLTPVKYLSKKQLLEYTVLLGYIEMETARSSSLRFDRKQIRKDMPYRGKGQYASPYKVYDKTEDGSTNWDSYHMESEWKQTRGQDKSGYPINPTKYKDMLDKADLTTYGRQLDRYAKKLEALRAEILAYVESMDLKKAVRSGSWYSISDVMKRLDDAIRYYEELTNHIEHILTREDVDDEWRNERIQQEFDTSRGWSTLGNLRDAIESAWKYLKEIKEDRDRVTTESVDEALNNVDEFKLIAEEVGLVTTEDIQQFREAELEDGEDELTAIKRYRQELLDAGIDVASINNVCKEPVDEQLTIHNFDEFKQLAAEVGLKTAGDLETFRREEMLPGEDELSAIKRYKQELLDAGVDLRALTEGAVKDIAQEIDDAGGVTEYVHMLEKQISDLNSELNYLRIYAPREVGRGGAYDSQREIDEAIEETQAELNSLITKLDIINK